MCGIAGILNPAGVLGSAEDGVRVVRAMTAALAHRGPDDDGLWVDPDGRCVLGHRRLKVVDLSDAGHQPMISSDGRWCLVHNGEIYNAPELRPQLEGHGHVFRGRSDTEVLAEGLVHWHDAVLTRLDGMFAFGAFDRHTGQLLLARDPFGEKPLYYTELGGGTLAFASELHALALVPGFDPAISLDAMAELLTFQYIDAPRTIYVSARKLPPGHWLRASAYGTPQVARHFRFERVVPDADDRPLDDAADELEALLVRSIRRRLVSDVPIGAFLSGGVDSSLVCALARAAGRPLTTFSIGFAEAPDSEHQVAAAFARHLGLEHHHRVLEPDVLEQLPEIGRVLDEPNVDWSCLPVYLLSRFARERVTVALSGDGGDEMFLGYGWYAAPLEAEGAGGWRADHAYAASLLMSGEAWVARLLGHVPAGLARRVREVPPGINEGPEPLAFRIRRNETEHYLPGAVLAKVDRMSMQHALEVRTPYLNTDVAEFAAGLPVRLLFHDGRGKVLLRAVAARHLPRDLVALPKRGFGIPGGDWGGPTIRAIARRVLGTEDGCLRAWIGSAALDGVLASDPDAHRQWALVVLESWLRHHPAKLPELTVVPAMVTP